MGISVWPILDFDIVTTLQSGKLAIILGGAYIVLFLKPLGSSKTNNLTSLTQPIFDTVINDPLVTSKRSRVSASVKAYIESSSLM